MKKEFIAKMTESLEKLSHTEQGVEYWMARDIQELLGYTDWRNFLNVIEKAKIACKTTGQLEINHFGDVNKMVLVGSGGTREVPDIMLTRYACYLIAQNGDPKKAVIAFAQSYFALQTRKQELLEKHISMIERVQARHKLTQTEKELSGVLHEHGIDNQGFACIRNVRHLLAKSNIYPEELPSEEDIKKLEKKLQKEDKKMIENPKTLPNLKT